MKYTLLALSLLGTIASAQPYTNWMASEKPVKSGAGLCWRSGVWTPATAHPDCDGADLQPKKVSPMPVIQPTVNVPRPTIVAPAAKPAEPVRELPKISLGTTVLFDFDKSVIKPEGRVALDRISDNIRKINLDVVVAIGHTDSIGSDAYNLRLGLRRAEAVKAYLVSKGLPANKITVESHGERQPIADNRTEIGRAQNRRVEIKITGTNR